jgi:hypothetical protein
MKLGSGEIPCSAPLASTQNQVDRLKFLCEQGLALSSPSKWKPPSLGDQDSKVN